MRYTVSMLLSAMVVVSIIQLYQDDAITELIIM